MFIGLSPIIFIPSLFIFIILIYIYTSGPKIEKRVEVKGLRMKMFAYAALWAVLASLEILLISSIIKKGDISLYLILAIIMSICIILFVFRKKARVSYDKESTKTFTKIIENGAIVFFGLWVSYIIFGSVIFKFITLMSIRDVISCVIILCISIGLIYGKHKSKKEKLLNEDKIKDKNSLQEDDEKDVEIIKFDE